MTPNNASGGWMGGSSPVRLSASIPGLEDDPKWRPTTSCPGPTSNEPSLMKDGGFAPRSSFSKGMLDDEWYMAPDNSLMDEMKELSYASSLASQQPDNASAAQFNLDSPHLQSFLSRNVSNSRTFSCNLDSRSNLPSYLDGGLPFDGSGGSGLVSNFRHAGGLGGLGGGNGMLDVQSGSCDGLGSVLQGSRSSGGLLMTNPSTRSSGLGDGGFALGGSLSSILTGGVNNSFSNVGGASLANAAPLHGSHSLGAAVTRVGNDGGRFGADHGYNNILSSRSLLGANKDQSLLLSGMERPPFRSKSMLSTPPPQLECATNSTAFPSTCPQPQTLYQKRVALRHSGSGGGHSPTIKSPPHVFTSHSNDSSVDMPDEESPTVKGLDDPVHTAGMPAMLPVTSCKEESRRPPKPFSGHEKAAAPQFSLDAEQRLDPDDDKDEDDMDESGDGSGVLYETDDTLGMDGGGAAGVARGVLGGEKGKGKKGLPAKNLMAERRRRKKLNDRLYMLRSVVPKITKMDRASILGDAIEYLKELLQRINDLNTELEETPSAERPAPSSPPPLPPTSSSLPCLVKTEPPASLPNPETQPARVEVRSRDGKLLNIHMFCPRTPGLLLSTMRALDGLGLDVQQAVISCFNGFALDVFKAEQSREGEVGPDEIRSVLLRTARSNGGSL